MSRILLATLAGVILLDTTTAIAQTDDGSLRGYVKDVQGGALPGVTVRPSRSWRRLPPGHGSTQYTKGEPHTLEACRPDVRRQARQQIA